jgi:hypothetical protein
VGEWAGADSAASGQTLGRKERKVASTFAGRSGRATEIEPLYGRRQAVRLFGEAARSGSALLGHGGVLLSHAVHVRDGGIDLVQVRSLLFGGTGDVL